MVLRPRLRIPSWAAVTIVAAAYVVRSLVRGGDFRPDLPFDAIVVIALAVLLALRLAFGRGSPHSAAGGDDFRAGREDRPGS